MERNKLLNLENKAKRIRYLTVDAIGNLGVGHIGGCLSIADVLTVLYFEQMNINPENPSMEGRDRLVLSKGHAGPALYATLAERGYFPVDKLYTLNRLNTELPSHCDMLRTKGIDMTAGSLGQGISCAVGIAKASKIKKDNAYIYAIIGDGESQEGQVWEACMAASHFKLDNFIVFLDYNKMQIDGMVDEMMSLLNPAQKFASFGFDVQSVDGHDIESINDSIMHAKQTKGKPSAIVLNTVKGKGVSFIEKAGIANHNMKIDEEQRVKALNELI